MRLFGEGILQYLYLSYAMAAFVMPAPIPLSDPRQAKIWHPKFPVANPVLKELYMNIGVLSIMKKSQNAKFTTNRFEGVLSDLALY